MEARTENIGTVALTIIATACALITVFFAWLTWHKSELRATREELKQAHRDKLALQREITRLLHIAYPDARPHERPEL